MDDHAAWLVDVLRDLIARHPTRAKDLDWLAAEASETHGADPQEARAAYEKHPATLKNHGGGDVC